MRTWLQSPCYVEAESPLSQASLGGLEGVAPFAFALGVAASIFFADRRAGSHHLGPEDRVLVEEHPNRMVGPDVLGEQQCAVLRGGGLEARVDLVTEFLERVGHGRQDVLALGLGLGEPVTLRSFATGLGAYLPDPLVGLLDL